MILLDTHALIWWVDGDGQKLSDRARELVEQELAQVERRGRITPAAIRRFLGLLETLPIAIDPPRIASAWHDSLAQS